jgi:hypothetical protein
MSRLPIEPRPPKALPVPETAPDRPEGRRGELHGKGLIAAVEARLALTSGLPADAARENHLSPAPEDARIGSRGPSQEVDP